MVDGLYNQRVVRLCPTIRENDLFKLYWDAIILIYAIWNCFMVPLVLFFEEFDEYFKE